MFTLVDNTLPRQKLNVKDIAVGEYFKCCNCNDNNNLYLKVSPSVLSDDTQKLVDANTLAIRFSDNKIVNLNNAHAMFYRVDVKILVQSIVQPN